MPRHAAGRVARKASSSARVGTPARPPLRCTLRAAAADAKRTAWVSVLSLGEREGESAVPHVAGTQRIDDRHVECGVVPHLSLLVRVDAVAARAVTQHQPCRPRATSASAVLASPIPVRSASASDENATCVAARSNAPSAGTGRSASSTAGSPAARAATRAASAPSGQRVSASTTRAPTLPADGNQVAIDGQRGVEMVDDHPFAAGIHDDGRHRRRGPRAAPNVRAVHPVALRARPRSWLPRHRRRRARPASRARRGARSPRPPSPPGRRRRTRSAWRDTSRRGPAAPAR